MASTENQKDTKPAEAHTDAAGLTTEEAKAPQEATTDAVNDEPQPEVGDVNADTTQADKQPDGFAQAEDTPSEAGTAGAVESPKSAAGAVDGSADDTKASAEEPAEAHAEEHAEKEAPSKFLEWIPPLREYRDLGPSAAPSVQGASQGGSAPPVAIRNAVRLWRGAAGTQAQAAVSRAEFKRRVGIILAIEEQNEARAIEEAEAESEAEAGAAAEAEKGAAEGGGSKDGRDKADKAKKPTSIAAYTDLASADDLAAPHTWGELNQAVDAMPGQYWCDRDGKPCIVAEGWANRVKDEARKRRYFVLTRQRLCFFFKEADAMVKGGMSCQTIHCAAQRDGSENEMADAAAHSELRRAESGETRLADASRAGRLKHKSSSAGSSQQFLVSTFYPARPGGILHGEFMHDHLSSFSSHGSSVRLADVRRVSWRIGRSSIKLKYFDGHEPTLLEADSPDTAQVWAEAIQEAVDSERRAAAGYAGEKSGSPDSKGGKSRAGTADSEGELGTTESPPGGRRHTVATTPDRSQKRGSIFGSLGSALSSPFRMFGGTDDPKAAEAARKKAEADAKKAAEEAAKRTKEQELKIKWDERKAQLARLDDLKHLRAHRMKKFVPQGCNFVSVGDGGVAPAEKESLSVAEGGCFKKEKQLQETRNQAWLEDGSGRPLVVLHGWSSKKDVGSSLFGDADRDRYLVLTPFHLCYFCSKEDADCKPDGFMHGKASGAHPSSFMGTGARLALEGIVDVEVESEEYSDDEGVPAAEEAGAGSEEPAKVEGHGEDEPGKPTKEGQAEGEKLDGEAEGKDEEAVDEAAKDADAGSAGVDAGETEATDAAQPASGAGGESGNAAAPSEGEGGATAADPSGAGAAVAVAVAVDETKVDPDTLPKVNLVADAQGRFEQSHIISLDMGDRKIRIELYTREHADRWCNAIERWSKWWKIRMDEAAMNAFGDAAAYRSMMQASGDGSIDDSAKQKEIAAMKASSGDGGGRKYVQGSRRGRGRGVRRGRGRGK